MGWDGWGTLAGKLSTYLPGRVEKLKNEKARLLDERNTILDNDPTASSIERTMSINKRLQEINTILGNKATD